jgi:hypothetical protein
MPRFNLVRCGHHIHGFSAPDLSAALVAAQSFATIFAVAIEVHPHEGAPGAGQQAHVLLPAQDRKLTCPLGIGV